MSVPAQYGPDGFESGAMGIDQGLGIEHGPGRHVSGRAERSGQEYAGQEYAGQEYHAPGGYEHPVAGPGLPGAQGIEGVDPSLAHLGGWPANELEEVLTAALEDPGATPRVIEVLGRSPLWVPLPDGTADAGLPAVELDGGAFVPVFSSENQMRRNAPGMAFGVLPAIEFARGLPPLVGIAVNPGGAVGIPLPAAAVEDLCRGGAGGGARVRLWEPLPDEEPVDFLAAAAGEFAVTPVVLSARRALGSVEGEPPTLFVGVELDRWQEEDRAEALDALGRALAVAALPWPVNLLLLDIAQDPLGDWMHERVEPFFSRD